MAVLMAVAHRGFLGTKTVDTPKPTPRNAATTVARRTLAGRAGATKSSPNWQLDAPERLWEIGSRFWLPFSPYSPPEYLNGSLPGDRGFDPFRLGESWGSPPDADENSAAPSDRRLGWLLEGELYNGRLAMLAVVGILVVEVQGKGPWWQAPYTANWPWPYAVSVITAHVTFALLEKKRLENWIDEGQAGHFGVAVFDPLNLSSDYSRQAEVRNARLAMLSALGFAVQGWATGKGPIQNAKDHLAAPFENNILTSYAGDKGLPVVYIFLAFSVALHLAEVARNNAISKNGRRYA